MFDAYLFLQHRPSYEEFCTLSDAQLQDILNYDNACLTFYDQIVHIVISSYELPDEKMYEFVRFLIEKGFTATRWDVLTMIEKNFYQLFDYYIKCEIVKKLPNHSLALCIKYERDNFARLILSSHLFSHEMLEKAKLELTKKSLSFENYENLIFN